MSNELKERVRRLIVLHITSSGYTVDEMADAVIALVLEEAAKVADENLAWDTAADLRALKEKP